MSPITPASNASLNDTTSPQVPKTDKKRKLKRVGHFSFDNSPKLGTTRTRFVGGRKRVLNSCSTCSFLLLTAYTQHFDAIVVASGRFNAPNTPDIPGLSQWASLYPHLISHSRQYRRPEEFANQSVLVIGGSVSGTEIAEELDGVAGKVILSVRDSEGMY